MTACIREQLMVAFCCISLCYVLANFLNGESALFSVRVMLHYIRQSGCATLEEFEQYAAMLLAVSVCARVLFS